jgi:protein-disulfide isomerase
VQRAAARRALLKSDMRVFLLTVFCSFQLAGQDTGWATAKTLPNVDFSGLSAAQQQLALKIFREETCSCGCTMKIAQCRVEDPKCTTSRGMTSKALKALREGKTEKEIRALLEAGPQPQSVLDDPVKLSLEGAPVKGPPTAKITLAEFSDFECPYCSKAVLELEAIQKAFPNDVKLIYKQFPLAAIHPRAMLAAQAAIAAHAQGKFWPLHDRMFANHTKLTRENILAWAKEFGCNIPKFTADMDSAKTKAQVARDLQQGEDAGVEGTPTIFVNGKHYNGSLELQPFGEVLRNELKAAQNSK